MLTLVNILSILKFFKVISGHKINLSKSGLASLIEDSLLLTAFASLDGCQILQWLLTYLGIPLAGNHRALSFWNLVVCNISKWLDCWKGTIFSLGGRITLIHSCLASIPSYFSPFLVLPWLWLRKWSVMRGFLLLEVGDTWRDHLVSWVGDLL